MREGGSGWLSVSLAMKCFSSLRGQLQDYVGEGAMLCLTHLLHRGDSIICQGMRVCIVPQQPHLHLSIAAGTCHMQRSASICERRFQQLLPCTKTWWLTKYSVQDPETVCTGLHLILLIKSQSMRESALAQRLKSRKPRDYRRDSQSTSSASPPACRIDSDVPPAGRFSV